MKKTTIAAMLIMGTVALGQAQIVRPLLTLVGTTSTSVTLQLQAGSQDTAAGFDVSWQQPTGDRHTLSITPNVLYCAQYALQPGQSVQFTVDGITDDACITYITPQALLCATGYRFFVKLHNYGTASNGVTVLTQPCD